MQAYRELDPPQDPVPDRRRIRSEWRGECESKGRKRSESAIRV